MSTPRPTSPKKHMSGGKGFSTNELAMASATATSVDGSSSFIPPTMLMNTSFFNTPRPRTNFASTARRSCMRSNLRPTAVRIGGACGLESPASARSLVSACTSSSDSACHFTSPPVVKRTKA